MSIGNKLMQAYFDYAYNPTYDFTTARINRYHQLQSVCVDNLQLEDNDRILCVGVGTGNEILHILEMNRNVDIVGVDYSRTALKRACRKALVLDKKIEGFVMDAGNLEFAAGSFDKTLCIHVMDFVQDHKKVTEEILRVLKAGGRFVITYPSVNEGPRLGLSLFSDSYRFNIKSGKKRVRAFLEPLARMSLGIVYLPLVFRSNRKVHSRRELEEMINQLTTGDFQITEDRVYQAFIVYGRK